MRTVTLLRLAPLALGFAVAAAPSRAADDHLDFAGAKEKAKAANQLVLVDFSAPT